MLAYVRYHFTTVETYVLVFNRKKHTTKSLLTGKRITMSNVIPSVWFAKPLSRNQCPANCYCPCYWNCRANKSHHQTLQPENTCRSCKGKVMQHRLAPTTSWYIKHTWLKTSLYKLYQNSYNALKKTWVFNVRLLTRTTLNLSLRQWSVETPPQIDRPLSDGNQIHGCM